jgi:prepilin-type processing-associated H-X9-DG protein
MQLGTACLNYEDANRVLPMGTIDQISSDIGNNDRRNWLFFILPFMEEEAIWENWHSWITNGGTAPWWYEPNRMSVLPSYYCPSDPTSPKTKTHEDLGPGSDQGFHSNYSGCSGSTVFNAGGSLGDTLNGIFYYKHSTPIRTILDGTSHTLMTSEIIVVKDDTDPNPAAYGHDVRGRMWNPANQGAILFSTQWPPNTPVSDVLNYCQQNNPLAPCISSTTNIVLYARSYHAGGVNAGLADGSVQFMTDSIDVGVFNALGTRSGGEIDTGY